ncbi:MAG: MgtC/SapB family protein [Clostridia bacterium]|nr:MgtC/SapB family protein [Clostridia bacterium]
MNELFEFLKTSYSVSVVFRLILAALLGGLIGLERGKHGRAAGLRTHILVCVGAAMTALTNMYLSEVLGFSGDVTRLSAQVISGIGFLGAGTILIRNSSVITGLTTAAGMWTTAAIGVALGYGFYAGAVIAAVICIFSVTVLSYSERKRKNWVSVYVELSDISVVEEIIEYVSAFENSIADSFDIIPAKSGRIQNVGLTFVLHDKNKFDLFKQQIKQKTDAIIVTGDLTH